MKWTRKGHSRRAKSLEQSTSSVIRLCVAAGSDPAESTIKAEHSSVLRAFSSIPVAKNAVLLCKILKIADCHLFTEKHSCLSQKTRQVWEISCENKRSEHREIQKRIQREAQVGVWVQKDTQWEQTILNNSLYSTALSEFPNQEVCIYFLYDTVWVNSPIGLVRRCALSCITAAQTIALAVTCG